MQSHHFLFERVHIGTVEYIKGNVILDSLPPDTRAAVFADVRVGGAESADLLVPDGARLESVIFPINALISITARLSDGHAFEVGTIGRQGGYGLEASFGVTTAARAALCQIEGSYAMMARDAFVRHVDRDPAVRSIVQRAYAAHMFAVEQTVTCNAAHSLGERAARWLLTISHQVGSSAYRLRAEFFAMMLGHPERRTQLGMNALSDIGAIQYEDQIVTICDSNMLEDAACECYGLLRDAWRRLIEGEPGLTA